MFFIKKRRADDNVVVYRMNYQNSDADYSETVYNFKGQTHYSMMIKKLCEWNDRCEAILNVLSYMRERYVGKQIMILGHNKSLLKYLHDAVEHRKIGTVGYYVGGMKEAALKETESKEVVIATCSRRST